MDHEAADSASKATVDASAQRGTRTLGDSAIEGVRWMGLARFVADAAAFAGSLVLARFISPAEFGYAAVALGLAAIVPNLLMSAFGTPLVQFPTLRSAHVETAMLLSVTTGAAFVLLVPLVSVAVIQPLLGARVADLLLIATPMYAAAALSVVPRAMIQRALAFRTLAMIEVVALLAGTAASVLLATLVGLEGGALVLGVVTLYVVTLLLLLVHAPRTSPRWRGATIAMSLIRFGGPVGLSSVLATIAQSIDYLVLSARLPAASVGYYWRAFTLAVTYPSKISNIMLSVALPLYSRAANADEMRRLRLRVMATHAAILFPLLVTLMVTAPVLVPWLFGPTWEPSVVPTQFLAGAGMVAAVVTGSPAFIIALGKPRNLPALTLTAVVGLATATYFAAPYGLNAVAAAVLGYYVFILLVNHFWLLHRVGGIAVSDLFRDAIPPLVGSLPLAACEFAMLNLLESAGSPPVVTIFVTSVVGLAAYAAVVRLAFPETWHTLRRLAERIVPSRSS